MSTTCGRQEVVTGLFDYPATACSRCEEQKWIPWVYLLQRVRVIRRASRSVKGIQKKAIIQGVVTRLTTNVCPRTYVYICK